MLVRRTSVRSLSQATSLQNKSKLYSFQVRKLWTSKVPAPRSLEGKSSHLKTYRKRDVNALVNTRHVVQQLSEGIVALRQGGWSGTETIFARTLLLQRARVYIHDFRDEAPLCRRSIRDGCLVAGGEDVHEVVEAA